MCNVYSVLRIAQRVQNYLTSTRSGSTLVQSQSRGCANANDSCTAIYQQSSYCQTANGQTVCIAFYTHGHVKIHRVA